MTYAGCFPRDLPSDLRLSGAATSSVRCARSAGAISKSTTTRSCVTFKLVSRHSEENMAASPLRGFDPDAGLPQDDDRDEGSRADGSDDDGSDASCDEAPEVGEQSEQEWAEFMFREKRLAKFLSNRSADKYVHGPRPDRGHLTRASAAATRPRCGSRPRSRRTCCGSWCSAASSRGTRQRSKHCCRFVTLLRCRMSSMGSAVLCKEPVVDFAFFWWRSDGSPACQPDPEADQRCLVAASGRTDAFP